VEKGDAPMTLKVGLIVGREWSFPPAFIEGVNKRDEGVVAEFVKLGGRYVSTGTDLAFLQSAATARAKQLRELHVE